MSIVYEYNSVRSLFQVHTALLQRRVSGGSTTYQIMSAPILWAHPQKAKKQTQLGERRPTQKFQHRGRDDNDAVGGNKSGILLVLLYSVRDSPCVSGCYRLNAPQVRYPECETSSYALLRVHNLTTAAYSGIRDRLFAQGWGSSAPVIHWTPANGIEDHLLMIIHINHDSDDGLSVFQNMSSDHGWIKSNPFPGVWSVWERRADNHFTDLSK